MIRAVVGIDPAACREPPRDRHRGEGSERTMRILVANDDGIYSLGIAALATIARQFGAPIPADPALAGETD